MPAASPSPSPIRITDVSPRDGLQNEPEIVPTARKVQLITRLLACGLDEIEITSFVSPKWVPQLGDAAQVCDALAALGQAALSSGPMFSALVPNEQGLAGALEANRRAGFTLLRKVSVFTAASETFSRKNTNASIAETIERFTPVIAAAHANNLLVRGYISCIIACPFEGPITPAAVLAVADQLAAIGVDELDLGDTIGAATPATTRALLQTLAPHHPPTNPARPTTLHLHDTFGHAAECIIEALSCGIRSFDGSVGGLGGCPYASTPGKRAPGNIDTISLIDTIRHAGYTTSAVSAALAHVFD